MAEEEEMDELKKELKKLSPRERINKLRELEEKTKDEITAIEDLIKDSEKELKADNVADGIKPEQEEVNIGRLFEEEGEQLENTVNEEAPPAEEGGQQGYFSLRQADEDYTVLKDIAYASMTGTLEPEQMEKIDRIGERLDRSKYHSQSAEVADILVASRTVLYKVKKYAGLERSGNF